jgi:hypothetical protein
MSLTILLNRYCSCLLWHLRIQYCSIGLIKNKSAYVTVRTLDHQTGEIQGQIVPTSTTVSCLTHARFGVPTTTPNVNNSLF